MSSVLEKLTSRATEEARRRQQTTQRPQAPTRPSWAADEAVPQVSLDAAYVGTIKPEDIPRDSVEYYDPSERKPSTGPLSEQQRSDLDAMTQLAKLGVL